MGLLMADINCEKCGKDLSSGSYLIPTEGGFLKHACDDCVMDMLKEVEELNDE